MSESERESLQRSALFAGKPSYCCSGAIAISARVERKLFLGTLDRLTGGYAEELVLSPRW
jgi:hypothetical protein